jgi:hypothetical protein
MVGISGHVHVEDKVVFGGMVGIHQNVRIGKLAMVGGMSKVVQDIPPFMIADGRPTKVYDLNVIGLRRNGVAPRARAGLRQGYKLLYRSSLNISQAIEAIEKEIEPSEQLTYLLDFVKNIKACSSKWHNEKYNANFHWQPGYAAYSVSKSALDTVEKYIQNQKEHHQRVSFTDEYNKFLQIHGFSQDV